MDRRACFARYTSGRPMCQNKLRKIRCKSVVVAHPRDLKNRICRRLEVEIHHASGRLRPGVDTGGGTRGCRWRPWCRTWVLEQGASD